MAAEVSFTREVWEVIKGIFVALLGFFGWQLKRQITRIDKLEKNSVEKETFNESMKALRKDIKDMSALISQEVRGVHERIDKMIHKD